MFSSLAARPNVLVMLADDLGWGDMSGSGHPTSHTPHLDTLASQSARLESFYSDSPVTTTLILYKTVTEKLAKPIHSDLFIRAGLM